LKPIELIPMTKEVEIEYTQNPVQLSAQRKKEIEDFWLEINLHNSFHRGEVFSVDSIFDQDYSYKIMLNRTDYAHYLHTVRNHINDEEGCKVVYGAGLVETTDSVFVFGEMASHTAYPGRLQCVGGGLSLDDKKGNYFDIKESVLRELAEELGVGKNVVEKSTPVFIKKGGTYDFIVILYHIKLKISENELIKNYQSFMEELINKGEKPEFQKVVYIKNKIEEITDFFNHNEKEFVDYLQPFLEQIANRHI
jgi:8-oxo-dGTP pyrophosphatase MutT (NUDIX family)